MRNQMIMAAVLAASISVTAQVASHASTRTPAEPGLMDSTRPDVRDKPVVKVNGAILTDRDLIREMYAIFPYGRQHNGFPKGMEAEIRQGALQMIIFEELTYQEGLRRKIVIPSARLDRATAQYRKQFPNDEAYRQFLKAECNGSTRTLQQKIRRSLVIEAVLNAEVRDKSRITLSAAKAYFEDNPKQFERPEKLSIQTISIIPPDNGGAEVQKEARKRADEALRQAQSTKTYRDFGLLAEKLSDDDWHVNMGDRHEMDASALPPPLVEEARKMKPGQVSGLLQFGPYYTLFRLNAHKPAGKASFEEVKAKLLTNLRNARISQLRSDLNRKLHQRAKIETM